MERRGKVYSICYPLAAFNYRHNQTKWNNGLGKAYKKIVTNRIRKRPTNFEKKGDVCFGILVISDYCGQIAKAPPNKTDINININADTDTNTNSDRGWKAEGRISEWIHFNWSEKWHLIKMDFDQAPSRRSKCLEILSNEDFICRYL